MGIERSLPSISEDIPGQIHKIVRERFRDFDPFAQNQPLFAASISHNGITYPCNLKQDPQKPYHELTVGGGATILMDFHQKGNYKHCPAVAFSEGNQPTFSWVEFSSVSTRREHQGKGLGSIAVNLADALVADFAQRSGKEIFAYTDDMSSTKWTTAAFTKNGYATSPINSGCFVLGLIKYGPRLYKWHKPSQTS